MCFSVTPVGRKFHYVVRVNWNNMDFRLFLMFVAGVFIFFSAKTLSQSSIFYYTMGTLLGIHMTLVFLLLLLRRFIPKYSSFVALMIGCWFASMYIMSQLMDDPKVLSNEHKVYSLGYVFIVGSLSFAVCYRHGPLVDARSITLLKWTLQLLSLLLVYWGVSARLFAFTAVGLLLASKGLHYPWKAFSYMRRKMKQWLANRKPRVKLLTEEEYREQADAETSRALEELRRACRGPDFPSWLVVSRLQAPKQFADFVMGGNHLSHEEMSLHEEQYGLGGAFLEDQLFDLAANMSQTSSSTSEMVDSRDC